MSNSDALQVRHDPSRPRQGRSVAGTVAPLAVALLTVVEAIKCELPAGVLLDWLDEGSIRDANSIADRRLREAWAVAAIALMHSLATNRPANFSEALEWFGDPQLAAKVCDLNLQ